MKTILTIILYCLLFIPIILMSQTSFENNIFEEEFSKYKFSGIGQYQLQDYLLIGNKIIILFTESDLEKLYSEKQSILKLKIINTNTTEVKEVILQEEYHYSGGTPILNIFNKNLIIFWGRYKNDFTYFFKYNLVLC